MNDYTLRLAPSPTSAQVIGIDINPQVTDLRWSTVTPGGFNQLEVGLSPDGGAPLAGGLQEPMDIGGFHHVELHYRGTLVFEGRVEKLTYNGTGVVGFSARGYGLSSLSDMQIDPGSGIIVGITIGDLISRAVGTGSRLIELDSWSLETADNGVRYGTSDLYGLTVRQVLDMATKQSVTGEQFDWWVYGRRVLVMTPRVVPSVPHFAVPFERGLTTWSEDWTNLWGGVTVYYTVAGVEDSITVTQDGFWERYGIERTTVLRIDEMTDEGAEAFARQWLETASQPAIQASVTRRDGRGVTTPSGAEVDAALVRAGSWWQMGGKPIQPAISSSHNATSEEHRWELGQPVRSIRNSLAVLQQDRHAFRDGVNPVSGGRKR